jgi:hypothetical protein
LSRCRNINEYPFVFVDHIHSRSTIFAQRKLSSLKIPGLIWINLLASQLVYGYDIESFLVCASEFTIKVTETNDKEKVRMAIYGRYLQSRIADKEKQFEEE